VAAGGLLDQRAAASKALLCGVRSAFHINLVGEGGPSRPVSPNEDAAAIFGKKTSNVEKKRTRQRLSNDTKVNAAYVTLKGVQEIATLIQGTITPLKICPVTTVGWSLNASTLTQGRWRDVALPWTWYTRTPLQKNTPATVIDFLVLKTGARRRLSSC
jgi:hypothetical protein